MVQFYPFPILPLPYSYVSLLPLCDADTLYHHHEYYAGWVRQLNKLVVRHNLTGLSLTDLITRDLNLPTAEENQVKNAAGIVYNHQLYFDGITSEPAPPPDNRLTRQLAADYGSLENFQRLVTQAAYSIPGVGWVWLISEGGGVHIATSRDNETVSLNAVEPIFIIDLWEHAYFSRYRFDKAAYLSAWFDMADWEKADRRFQAAGGPT